MAASYPSSAKSFTPIVDGVDYPQAAQVNQSYDEITAVEQGLINGLAHDLKFTDATYDIGKTGATRPRDIFLSRDLTVGDQIFERGRSVAQGEWTTPTFSAGDFTASGSMTWTVASGDVGTYAYTLVGKTMTVVFVLNTTTVGGTPSTSLLIAIPNSKVATKNAYNPVLLIDNGTRATGYASVAASATTIAITRTDAANFTAAVDTTYVFGQITFEIN